eukprot:TRINITY_DN1445_c0_g1_i6.p1 TRINITY_DN1445_c0_g1~~TRINITY_DN1445_c0_g1_i6.p1  ORF type:complete len:333 (-),score=74.85 TRINITY_DN1445_c0_g1_i6:238-1236(-)
MEKSHRKKPDNKKSVKRGASAKFEREVSEDSLIDSEFNKLFKIKSQEPEVVVKTFLCTLKSSITAHGTLFLTKNFLCFHASTFGRRTKEVIAFSSISKLENNDKGIIVELNGKVCYLKDFGASHKEAWSLIYSVYQNRKTEGGDDSARVIEDDDDEEKKQDSLSLLPTDEDWTLILSGTRSVRYHNNQYVIQQEQQQHQRIFQIAKGKCRIEKQVEDGSTITLDYIRAGSIFGEISFLEGAGGKATASVVADENDTMVHIIEGFFLDIAFEYYPGLSGRFYHYLAQILSGRLKQREAGTNVLQRTVIDEEESVSEQERGPPRPKKPSFTVIK